MMKINSNFRKNICFSFYQHKTEHWTKEILLINKRNDDKTFTSLKNEMLHTSKVKKKVISSFSGDSPANSFLGN